MLTRRLVRWLKIFFNVYIVLYTDSQRTHIHYNSQKTKISANPKEYAVKLLELINAAKLQSTRSTHKIQLSLHTPAMIK